MSFLTEFKEWLQAHKTGINDRDTVAALRLIQKFEEEEDAPALGDLEEEEGEIILTCWLEPNKTWAGEVVAGSATLCQIMNGESPEVLAENLRKEHGIYVSKIEIRT